MSTEQKRPASSSQNKSLLTGVNAEYIAHLYAQYLRAPSSVNASWQSFFADLSDDELTILRELHGASWTPEENRAESRNFIPAVAQKDEGRIVYLDPRSTAASAAAHSKESLKMEAAERALRTYGHYRADLDPLGITQHQERSDLPPRGTLPELEAIYCGTVGYEYMHITNNVERAWLQEKIEQPIHFNSNEKSKILNDLTRAEGLEKYLSVKYVGVKRFGLEGGESMMAALEEVLNRGSEMGVVHAILGMAHRGRLNVVTNTCGKPFAALFSEFNGVPSIPEGVPGSGDVKYHNGYGSDRKMRGGDVHVALAFNPSHLEFVNAVVGGRSRAFQAIRHDTERSKVLPILIHGDAAFAGQGIVAECLMMSGLDGYKVGGTVHVIINNQVGFTTSYWFSRSGPYCSDVAKMIDAPIFHVNGDDPEAVVRVARLAMEYRQTFKKDVVIDLVCYRRNGHNETDEPAFTQPQMYKRIAQQESTRTLYARNLVKSGTLTQEQVDAMSDAFKSELDTAFEAAKSFKPSKVDTLEASWKGIEQSVEENATRNPVTAISKDTMDAVVHAVSTAPQGIEVNPKILRQLDAKKQMGASGEGFDWAMGEALAFGSLVSEGFKVRLSGQDCGRGTFSHRHACLTCQSTGSRYYPLQNVTKDQATFEVLDSPLSECGVMGFEYGYSLADPKALVIWEGQFGDFANGAQVIIDQFIASSETKWMRMSGLTLLLPHGMEGQGPEHSSARLERFLQLSAEDNWSVVNCSTPASLFHVLRRQMHRPFRKPLVIMSPKSLLRHKRCVSTAADFTGATTFQTVINDAAVDAKSVRRVVLCSGKVYYDLLESREEKGIKDVALVRVEQLYPFPADAIAAAIKSFPKADSVVWCQEEAENQGAWMFVDRRLETVLQGMKHKAGRAMYAGRAAGAAPATGSAKTHAAEQAALVAKALTV